jgi:N6-L-threonylcarbamoyladenine synthase
VHFPPVSLCSDNGALIAFAAGLKYGAARLAARDAEFSVLPRWDLGEAKGEAQSTPRR